MERAMTRSTIAQFARGAATAVLACCLSQTAHAQTRLAADKITSQQVEQTLQDTRATIKSKQPGTTTAPVELSPSNQLIIDICKKNSQLPQCKR
jgi:hypothetical protein